MDIRECLAALRRDGELTMTDLDHRRATGKRVDLHEVRVLTDESELHSAWAAGFRPATSYASRSAGEGQAP